MSPPTTPPNILYLHSHDTGRHCHTNEMMGLAHRGWPLVDDNQHWVHPVRAEGYHSALIGEQHVSVDPEDIGYDQTVPVSSNTPPR